MELIQRHRRRLVALAVILGVLAVLALFQLLRVDHWNALMTRPALLSAPGHAPPDVQIAAAQGLAARGKFWEALSLYQQLIDSGDPATRLTAQFNQANLLLRQAAAFHAAGDDGRAQPLVQLAKESYRRVLREEPALWDARYNLELALRWAPEADEPAPEESPPPLIIRRSRIIERGVSQGLP